MIPRVRYRNSNTFRNRTHYTNMKAGLTKLRENIRDLIQPKCTCPSNSISILLVQEFLGMVVLTYPFLGGYYKLCSEHVVLDNEPKAPVLSHL